MERTVMVTLSNEEIKKIVFEHLVKKGVLGKNQNLQTSKIEIISRGIHDCTVTLSWTKDINLDNTDWIEPEPEIPDHNTGAKL